VFFSRPSNGKTNPALQLSSEGLNWRSSDHRKGDCKTVILWITVNIGQNKRKLESDETFECFLSGITPIVGLEKFMK
jgi:hypothetical protein